MGTQTLIVAYYALVLVIVGTCLNLLTFVVMYQSNFRQTRTRTTRQYILAISIFDILTLYGWNLRHYLSGVHGFTLEHESMFLCKYFAFFNYFTAQTSAWLRVLICFDRYLSLSRTELTWFNRSKNVPIVVGCVIGFFALLNGILFIYGCSYDANGNLSNQGWAFNIYPLWDYVNLVFYNCLPFFFMVLCNSGVIYYLTRVSRTTAIQTLRLQNRATSLTLLITTFLFIVMTVPATIAFAFFSTSDKALLSSLDGILYTYHVMSFPLYLSTLAKFRRKFWSLIICKHIHFRVAPLM